MKTIFNISFDMIVCVCKAVSDRDIARAIAEGARTVADVARCTSAGTGCGSCRDHIAASLDMATGATPAPTVIMAGPARIRERVVLPMLPAIA